MPRTAALKHGKCGRNNPTRQHACADRGEAMTSMGTVSNKQGTIAPQSLFTTFPCEHTDPEWERVRRATSKSLFTIFPYRRTTLR